MLIYAQAPFYPAMARMWGKWAPQADVGTLSSLTFSGMLDPSWMPAACIQQQQTDVIRIPMLLAHKRDVSVYFWECHIERAPPSKTHVPDSKIVHISKTGPNSATDADDILIVLMLGNWPSKWLPYLSSCLVFRPLFYLQVLTLVIFWAICWEDFLVYMVLVLSAGKHTVVPIGHLYFMCLVSCLSLGVWPSVKASIVCLDSWI